MSVQSKGVDHTNLFLATEMKEKIEKFKTEKIGSKKKEFVETVERAGGDQMDTSAE